MIENFKCKETEKVFARQFSKKLPTNIQSIALRKLRMLNRSSSIQDLRIPPANRLEVLSGKRKGQHSIRVNQQWRICFEWKNGNAYNVEVVDYHWGDIMKKIPTIRPGEILLEEFLKPMNISQNQLGRDLGVSPRRINEIIHGKRSITADTALRLSTYFGNSASFWLGLQMDYDLDIAEDTLSKRIHKEVHQLAVA